jgi:hypothetical protein
MLVVATVILSAAVLTSIVLLVKNRPSDAEKRAEILENIDQDSLTSLFVKTRKFDDSHY